jgi:hypothetical protein
MSDPLTAAFDEIMERYAKAETGIASNPVVYIDSADDVPRLLAALDAVLKHHPVLSAVGYCETCARPYPCAEVQDITRALTGGTDG